MNSTDSLSSCYQELSNLSQQLQTYRNLLLNSPYIEHMQSSNTSPHNSQYFPYYALVEKYLSFADEFNVKLKASLLINPTESEQSTSESDEETHCNSTYIATNAVSEEEVNPPTPTRTPSPCSITLDSYLPIIEEDKETEYYYNDSEYVYAYDRPSFVFTEPIYCHTLLFISNTNGNDYDEIMALLVGIGGFHPRDIDNIIFKEDHEGNRCGLIGVKQSMDYIRCALDNIEHYSIQKRLNIQINVMEERRKRNDDEITTKQSDTLQITNFDIVNGNIECDLVKLFTEYGEINHIEIVTKSPYAAHALLQFKSIKDAVHCFTAHNVNNNPLYFASRLLQIDYAN